MQRSAEKAAAGRAAMVLILLAPIGAGARASEPAEEAQRIVPPATLEAFDAPWDGGDKIVLRWRLDPDGPGAKAVDGFRVFRAGEASGPFQEIGSPKPEAGDFRRGWMRFVAEKCELGEDYYFRLVTAWADGTESEAVRAGPVQAARQAFDRGRLWLGLFAALVSAAVLYWIWHARSGRKLAVRKIAGLEAVDEAVGRATEMGRSCLFIPGTQDMNEIQTIAGLTVLGRVAQTAAEYGARVEVPTCRSLVMTAARETVATSFLTAGRPDAYREDDVYYVTDEQFGYVAHLTGTMVRQRPAACFYMGAFFAESLIIAETGNAIGAIQVAGTAMPSQLPFFVAACDYTLIGEEFFAASAYLSGEPQQLGSLKGQDVGKLVAGAVLVGGCALATLAAVTGSTTLADIVHFLKDTVLQ